MIVPSRFPVAAGSIRSWLQLTLGLALASLFLLVLVPDPASAKQARNPLPAPRVTANLAVQEQVQAFLESPPQAHRNRGWFSPPEVPQSAASHWVAREFPGAPYFLIPLGSNPSVASRAALSP